MPNTQGPRPAIENPSHVPPCPGRRPEHRWKITALVSIALFGVMPPWLTIRCARCGLVLHADVRRITRPLLPPRHIRASHARIKKGTTR